MPSNLFRFFILVIVIYSLSATAFAHKDEQAKLDQACEDARQIALAPRRKEIYQECIQKFKKSEAVCLSEAKAYNGNRINGAPLFYELPACEKAFAFRKKHAA
ncbi:hypothetical protein [Colwellia psychrerythraea]|uniref:Uncharacterized protein n=1 Tax=Colwellia psychrerythraea (strain 34H / ATCC BAA-681) TaxID=167879 RepID=Q482Q1_COLP3|nr:hypothetical protein [Colwellia psychrerythraea]AAZ28469.1 hypothetical protein CPS_2241 [Colwellia psychrerythraea 34H]